MNAPEDIEAGKSLRFSGLSSGTMARGSSEAANASELRCRAAATYSHPGVSRDSVLVSTLSPNGAGSASRSPNRLLHPARRETRDRPGIRRGSCLGHIRAGGLSVGPLAESLARSRIGTLLRIVQSRSVEADSQESTLMPPFSPAIFISPRGSPSQRQNGMALPSFSSRIRTACEAGERNRPGSFDSRSGWCGGFFRWRARSWFRRPEAWSI